MELEKKAEIFLSDGKMYSGWGYYKNEEFIPHGCGKKFYDGYYALGNFKDGELDGPAIISHNHYMHTVHFKNNRGNGWGLSVNSGKLTEFGYYKDSELKNDLSDFALWYFTKLMQCDRKDDCYSVFTDESHEVSNLLIGYRPSIYYLNDGLRYMGFQFMKDGSVWMGNTDDLELSGNLIHFCPNGTIECGLFHEGKLLAPMKLQSMIDSYYGTFSYIDDIVAKYSGEKTTNSIRNQFHIIRDIEQGYNYFEEI